MSSDFDFECLKSVYHTAAAMVDPDFAEFTQFAKIGMVLCIFMIYACIITIYACIIVLVLA